MCPERLAIMSEGGEGSMERSTDRLKPETELNNASATGGVESGAAATIASRPVSIPLTRSNHTFRELHIQRINETEATMIQQVKKNRKKWEKEVNVSVS